MNFCGGLIITLLLLATHLYSYVNENKSFPKLNTLKISVPTQGCSSHLAASTSVVSKIFGSNLDYLECWIILGRPIHITDWYNIILQRRVNFFQKLLYLFNPEFTGFHQLPQLFTLTS